MRHVSVKPCRQTIGGPSPALWEAVNVESMRPEPTGAENREAPDSARAPRRSWLSGKSHGRNRGKHVLVDKPAIGDHHCMSRAEQPREIVILAYEGVQSLDITGPLEVFFGAQRLIDDGRAGRGYRVTVLSADAQPVTTSSGLTIASHGALAQRPARIDTLLVPGGQGCREACRDAPLLRWVASTAADARRTVSVCTGAFLLAEAGLLSGRRATTHWSAAAALARLHPDVQVDPEPIFLRDGPIWTSAG